MSDLPFSRFALRVSDLPASAQVEISVRPNHEETAALRDALNLDGLKKVRLSGALIPQGKRDWRLRAELGATVTQPCVATLEPVQTRIDVPVTRTFLAEYEEPTAPEVEMTEDETVEPLPAVIDPWLVVEEALSLALPLYPRSEDANPVEIRITEPGQVAMSDDDAKPFAGLAALKSQLSSKEDE